MADADTTAPVLTSLSLPGTIDLSRGNTAVTATVGATDTGLGVDTVFVTFDRSFQGTNGRSSGFYLGTSDTFADGVSSNTQIFTTETASGTYGIESVTVYDRAGNYTIYQTTDLQRLGFQTSFKVVGGTAPDTTAPVLTSLSLPGTIDLSRGNTAVTATVGATDAGLGVDTVFVTFDRSFQGTNGRSSGFYLGTSDTFADGVSSNTQIFTTETASGTYGIESVTVYDRAGNYTIYQTTDLQRLGFQTSFKVVGGTAPDTTAPVLTSLSLPGTIDLSRGNTAVTATVGATDAGSGVDTVFVTFDRSFQGTNGRSSGFYLGTSDTFADGVSSNTQIFTTETASGTYGIESVTVYDRAGNYTIYQTTDLQRLGFQTSFKVTNINLVNGTTNNDALRGTEREDQIDGKSGSDSMTGLGGNDLYYVDNAGDRVFEAAGGGTDRVLTSVSYTLAAGQEIERLDTTSEAGTGAINLTGNEFANTLVGNAGTNVLNGGAGADLLYGRGGNDVYAVDNVGDRVFEGVNQGTDTVVSTVSYVLAAGQSVEALQLASSTGSQALNLTGNEFANTLRGNAGANLLNGGGGVDLLYGGAGNDVYAVDNVGDRVFEGANQGTDTVVSTVSYVLAAGQSVEALQLASSTGSQALNLTGNEFANTLRGNAGANLLNGGGGVDLLYGGAGNDVYAVDNVGDRVFEGANQGTDTVVSTVSYVLAAGQSVEALQLASSTGSQALNLTGNEFANTLRGNAGANLLDGGAGTDILVGGAGADTFVFKTAFGPANVDHIVDFTGSSASIHDTIQLAHGIFTALAPGVLGTNAFKDLSLNAADASDRILYDRSAGALFYDADGSGTVAKAVQFAVIDTKTVLTHADFFVV